MGSLTDENREVQGLVTVQLGEGSVGRVARRGKTVSVTSVDEALSEGSWGAGIRCGIIVPLIVGARVVGTLGCWSRSIEAFSDDDQRVLEMMASQVATAVVAADSTELNERRALLDPLTGLSNRRQLDEDLGGLLAQLSDSGRSAVVAMVDVDHFKRFNDDYGHQVGDVTLQKVAAVMRSSIRESDRVYRYGGEEFVMIFVDADRDQGIALAERARIAVSSSPLTGSSLEPVGPVTISIGLAFCPEHSRDFGVLIQFADQAMYRSKQEGRDRVTAWSVAMDQLKLVA
jgi:diguanylate cyclase (GGDEF)-like protein